MGFGLRGFRVVGHKEAFRYPFVSAYLPNLRHPKIPDEQPFTGRAAEIQWVGQHHDATVLTGCLDQFGLASCACGKRRGVQGLLMMGVSISITS